MAHRFGLALGIAALGLSLAAMTGCGSDDEENSGGSGGTAGATGGTGGATGGTGGATGGTGGEAGGTGGATGGTGGETGGTGGATGGTGGATGGTGGATGGTGGEAGGTGGTDNDNSCAEATDISADGKATGEISPPDEADFYSFPFEEGDWIMLRASTTLPEGQTSDDFPYEDVLDTAITVYDQAGNLVASMDDAYPRYSTDSSLVWRVPTKSTYCIKVEDWASWAGDARPDEPTGKYFEYELGIYSPDPDAESNAIDTEPNNDATEAQAQGFKEILDDSTPTGNYFSTNYGTLETDEDVDVFSFTMPDGTVQLSTGDFTTPIGPGSAGVSGNGSTLELGLVSISDASGTIIAQLDAQKGSSQINAPLEAGTDYLLWVTRNGGTTASDNDFYNIDNFAWSEDSQRETETDDATNNTSDSAETLTIETSDSDPNLDSGYILGFINSDTDVDYFAFEAEAGDTVNMVCSAVRGGSGLIDATFAINDPDDAEMQSETETDTADVWWADTSQGASKEAITIATTGTHYLVVNAGEQSTTVTGNYYRCGVHVTTPPAP